MTSKDYLFISKKDKRKLWEQFHYEERLCMKETILLSELEFYEDRICSIGEPDEPLDIAILDMYKSHIENIRQVLKKLDNTCQADLHKVYPLLPGI